VKYKLKGSIIFMTSINETKPFDMPKLEAFVGKAVTEAAITLSSTLVLIGDKLGLYKAMAGSAPLTSTELAARTHTSERYVREWLINQAAGGFIDYDSSAQRYSLSPENAVALTDESSPAFVMGLFQTAIALSRAESRIIEAFQTGNGMFWGEHDHDLFQGTQRSFRPGYTANLVSNWLPALEGVTAKLEAGASVADVGCGIGMSTILMAQAYPRSRFVGFDFHAPSIEQARQEAIKAGVADRVTFEVTKATEYPGTNYDLIAFFDCLHDMGNPIAVIKQARKAIAPDGTVLLVEPMAGEKVEDNFNPVGRFFSAASTMVCTPNSIAGGGNPSLGAVATEQQTREVVLAGGFSRFRRAMDTTLNRMFEVRP
jgi:2-polyprenyl-3-methyl-5-hydroxy-6-metoxy-1,4-benzoquinol methylase